MAVPLHGDNSRKGHQIDSEMYLTENSSEEVEAQVPSQPIYNTYGRISDTSPERMIVPRKKFAPIKANNVALVISNHGAD